MEIQKNYYAIIPANVRYDEELTPNAKLLYGEITALCNEKGYCWATNDYFAKLYKVSKVSISKWISQLVAKEYLKSEMIYKEGTKEILNRYIRIVNEPIKENFNTPPKEKLKDNTTLLNTTSNNTLNNIYTVWNECKIINHRNLTKDIEKAYKKISKDYTEEEIVTAIKNYSGILNDDKYFFKYKWSLSEFLTRGLGKFIDWEVCSNNYLTKGGSNGGNTINNQQTSKFAHIKIKPPTFTDEELREIENADVF